MKNIDWQKILKLGWPFLKAVLILLVGHYIIVALMKLPKRALARTKIDASIVRILLKVINIAAHAILILSALNSVGISTTGLLAALSAAAVGVALALKDSLGSIAGGIILLLSPRFSTGDYIAVDGEEGYVDGIDLMHTTIRTYNNRHIAFSNAILVNSTITNYTWEGIRRIDISFPISYDADIELAEEIAIGVMKNHPKSLKEPEKTPIARVGNYGDSAVLLDLRIWCKCEDYWTVYYDTMENVRKAFTAKGITIPYNQLDVHLDPPIE